VGRCIQGTLDAGLWDGWYSDGAGHWFIEGPCKDMDAGIVPDYVPDGQTTLVRMPHVLGLHESGCVEGWGAHGSGETDAPSLKFRAIAGGKAYRLGLDEGGFLHEWGRRSMPLTTSSGAKEKKRVD
jgi:hypothetical protein